MKNEKLKSLLAKEKFEIKADDDFVNLNEEFISSVKGGTAAALDINFSCPRNSGCGKAQTEPQ